MIEVLAIVVALFVVWVGLCVYLYRTFGWEEDDNT
jgi:hypothetical protein